MKEYRQYFLPEGLTTDRLKWKKKDADKYLQWFLQNKQERIIYFLNYFNEHFEKFDESDVKRLSHKLYERLTDDDCWFYNKIEIKNIHETRFETVKSLTNSGIPMTTDFGIVFAEILEKTIPGLKWVISKGNKRTLHYFAPVLVGFRQGLSNAEYDPIHYGIGKSSVMLNDNNPNEWREFYKTILIMWNRKTPSLKELIERKNQGKSTNIEDIQREKGWL